MAARIIIPKLGVSTDPVFIVAWKVEEGAYISEEQEILTVETEKSVIDIKSEASGYVHILLDAEQEVPIGTVAGYIAESQEEYSKIKAESGNDIISKG